MDDSVEIAISGTVTTKVRINVRLGSPATSAPVVRKLDPNEALKVVAVAVGEAVEGNAHWYRIADAGDKPNYVWAGGCSSLEPMSQPNQDTDPAGRWAVLSKIPLVIDMSHGDGVTDFITAKTAGLAGIIHKATTGVTGVDDAYADRRIKAEAAGLLWGAYHWGTAAPISGQVAHFLDVAKPDERTLVALDYEGTPGNQMTLDGAKEFSKQISDKLGRLPVIYSGETLKSALGDTIDPFFAAHRLWLAQYGAAPTPQKSWSSFWLWQYTDGEVGPPGCRSVPGIIGDSKGRLDCNYFEGNAALLAIDWAT
jgi:GH25 family lysozyme M1 (1,4-beta-N-acetylmuramidase)